MKFEELRNFLENQMMMVENYQPIMIKSLIQHNGKATKQEIIQDLQNKNPDLPKEHFDNSPVFKVLTNTHHVAQFNDSEKTYEMLDYETYAKEEKEWITNFCDTKISVDIVSLKNWIWPVNQENWPTVKKEKVWAVGKKGKGARVKKGDKIVFYLNGTMFFAAIYTVTSDWHEPKIVWPDEIGAGDKSVAEIDLEVVQLGFASVHKLLDDLKFIKRKSPGLRGLSLRGTPQGPANSGQPISEEDYNLILEELKRVQEEPNFAKIKEEKNEVVDLVDVPDLVEEPERIPTPEKKTISDIYTDVEKGRYAIPNFQRYWTWNRSQIEELWESIFRAYYIGSLLHWETRQEKLDVTSISGAPPHAKNPDLILDGQQRITAIYYAIKAPGIPLPSSVRPYVFFLNINALLDRVNRDSSEIIDSYHLNKAKQKKYFERKTQFEQKIFPLSELKENKYTEWLFEFQEYLQENESFDKDSAVKVYKKLNSIFNYVWAKYEIPIVKLPETLTLDNVATVFEKINSKGTPLSLFDLLNARFILYKIGLKKLWEDTKETHENMRHWYDDFKNEKVPIYVLQSISLFKKGFLRRSEVLRIDESYSVSGQFQKDEFLNDWNEMAKFVEEAIKRLKDRSHGFGAINYDLIPYTVMVPILATLLKEIENRDDRTNCLEKISFWYWNNIIGDKYSGSTDSKVEADHKAMNNWFDDTDEKPFPAEEGEDINTSRASSAIYKGIMCLVTKKGALDFVRDDPPDYSKLEDHHIFPKSKAKQYGAEDDIDSILNRTLIFEKTNLWITNKDPSDYLSEIMNIQKIDEQEMRKRLATHLISSEAFDCMLKNDFAGFIKAREKTILEEMNKMAGVAANEIPTQTSKDTPYGNVLAVRNTVRSCNKEIMWVSKYWGEADLEILYKSVNDTVKKIRILLSRKRKYMKSDFKRFRDEKTGIECEMRVMSKKVEGEIHDRYLISSDKCYNMIDTDIAKRGQASNILSCDKPKNLERWWEDSYDIFRDWGKFQD